MWATKVCVEQDGSILVDTPISIERGFTTEQAAIDYAMTWGRIDARKIVL